MTHYLDGGRDQEMSREEKEEIARALIEGYKKMADLNRELAEDGFPPEDEKQER
ncbi:MAG: hypothetical protein ACOCQC_00765 [Halanaerobiaceae bacterium]